MIKSVCICDNCGMEVPVLNEVSIVWFAKTSDKCCSDVKSSGSRDLCKTCLNELLENTGFVKKVKND